MTVTGVEVRPAVGSDDIDALAVDDPEPHWYTMWQRMDSDELAARWVVGLLNGEPVGVGGVVVAGLAAGGAAPMLLTVRRAHRRRGVGTALLRALGDAARGGVPALHASIIEGEADSQAAVAAWGLSLGPRHAESVLHLGRLDRALLEAKASLPHVEIAPLPDLASMSEHDWRDLHAFVVARNRESPDLVGADTDMPLLVFTRLVEEPWMMCTARVDGELVGMTFVCKVPGTHDVNTMLTGVVPAFRGRGIASALKSAQALLMADLGIDRQVTQNMAGNDHILAANRTLGFVPHRTAFEVRVPLS